MNNRFSEYTIYEQECMLIALEKIDNNKQGFVIVLDNSKKVIGVLTDGDIRRSILRGNDSKSPVSIMYTKKPQTVNETAGFETVTELFKNQSIKFLPIISSEGFLVNIITKNQMHALLLQDINFDLHYDFFSVDTSLVDHEIYQRPWGYYKTTVLNDYYQGKIITVKPGQKLSLQSHNHREEHWIVVHGTGTVQLDDSSFTVSCGSSVFVPKGCRHRLINTGSTENLIISEVQIGDYFGEDDIVRYEDIYGRS